MSVHLVTDRASFGIVKNMEQATQQSAPAAVRTVDVTGLPEDVIHALESFVATLRNKPAVPLHSAPYEVWLKGYDEWIKSHPKRETWTDWSRESIYEGRGE